MSKLIGIIIAIVVIIGGVYLVMTSSVSTTDESSSLEEQSEGSQGRVVFSVTDAAVNMESISEINLKISKVDVHSNESGWVTVSTAPRTYNPLALNASSQSELSADAQVSAGSYDQVRLMVDSVSVKTKAGATSEAKLPSGELKINTALLVKADSTASVNIDFLADKSLHMTGNGKYIFAPVVKTETRSDADVSIDAKNVVKISGGTVGSSNTVGMDIDGSVKANFEIKSDTKLDIDSSGVIKLNL